LLAHTSLSIELSLGRHMAEFEMWGEKFEYVDLAYVKLIDRT